MLESYIQIHNTHNHGFEVLVSIWLEKGDEINGKYPPLYLVIETGFRECVFNGHINHGAQNLPSTPLPTSLPVIPRHPRSSVIRLNMPPVTEDRRKELAKEAKALGEEGKVGLIYEVVWCGVVW